MTDAELRQELIDRGLIPRPAVAVSLSCCGSRR